MNFKCSPTGHLSSFLNFLNSNQVAENMILVHPLFEDRVYLHSFKMYLQVECACLPLVNANVLSNDNPISAILNLSGSVSNHLWDTWLACHIVRKASIFASASTSSLYLGYGYDIVSSCCWSNCSSSELLSVTNPGISLNSPCASC